MVKLPLVQEGKEFSQVVLGRPFEASAPPPLWNALILSNILSPLISLWDWNSWALSVQLVLLTTLLLTTICIIPFRQHDGHIRVQHPNTTGWHCTFGVLWPSMQTFPAKNSCLVSFTLWFRGKPIWCRFSHSSSITIFLPVSWGETLLSSQFTFLYICTWISAIPRHRQLSVLSIFYSAARSHSVSAGFRHLKKQEHLH